MPLSEVRCVAMSAVLVLLPLGARSLSEKRKLSYFVQGCIEDLSVTTRDAVLVQPATTW